MFEVRLLARRSLFVSANWIAAFYAAEIRIVPAASQFQSALDVEDVFTRPCAGGFRHRFILQLDPGLDLYQNAFRSLRDTKLLAVTTRWSRTSTPRDCPMEASFLVNSRS